MKVVRPVETQNLICTVALSAGLFLAAPVSAANYGVVDLGRVLASGINASGQVVGSFYTANQDHAFITSPNGVGITNLGTLGGIQSNAYGVNAAGRVVGASYTVGQSFMHAFITGSDGIGMKDLGTLGGTSSGASGINAAGQVVGSAALSYDYPSHAFITGPNGMGMHDLGTLGGTSSGASGINASGQVIGSSGTPSRAGSLQQYDHAFITGPNGTSMTDLGTLGGNESYATAINDSGQVVGYSFVTGAIHAFITGPNGVGMTDLGISGGLDPSTYTFAAGISAAGRGGMDGNVWNQLCRIRH